jgi:hypothetical protein
VPKSANPLLKVQNNHASLKRSVSTPQLGNKRRNQALDILINGRSTRVQNPGDQAIIRSNGEPRGVGFSIKGSASQAREYPVVAQNFAPGTTAEDIGSVFAPDADAAGLVSCKLLVASPTVIAELIFNNQDSAEEVVKLYNGKKADNRVLYVYHSDSSSQRQDTPTAPRPRGLASRVSGAVPVSSDDSIMEVDDARPRYQQPYTMPRGQRAQLEVQDGRYGFGDNVYRPRHESRNDGGLVSDSLVSDSLVSRQGRGRNDGGSRQWRR